MSKARDVGIDAGSTCERGGKRGGGDVRGDLKVERVRLG